MTVAAVQAIVWALFAFVAWVLASSIRNALPTIRQAIEREDSERHGS